MKNTSIDANEKKPGLRISALFAKNEFTIFLVLIAICIIFYLNNNMFASPENVFSVLKTLAFQGMVAVGMTLLILSGDIDISVGSTASLGAILSTFIMMEGGCFGLIDTPAEPWGVALSMIIAAAVCSLVGLLNGFMIIKVKLPPFIATVATMYGVRGLVMVITNGDPIYPLPKSFMDGLGTMQINWGDSGTGLSLFFIVFVVLIVVFELLLRYTRFGRNIYATGDNIEVAKLSGINTDKVRYMNFIITAILAAVSGMFVAAFTRQGYPPIGQGWELMIIAATAIGGISLTGGAGSMIGTLLGVFIMNLLNNGLVMTGMNTFLQTSVIGMTIIVTVAIDRYRQDRKVKA